MLLDTPSLGGRAAGDDIALLEPATTVAVPLHLQQWKLRSAVLDRVAAALRKEATRELLPV
jgi:LysR family transcriptional regulator (chromosome initiation inhibitor)